MNTNLEELSRLLKDFYTLTGIKICLYDINGEETTFYPERFSNFCAYLRSDKNADFRCKKCDYEAIAKCRKLQKTITYTCHAGLIESISPIVIDQQIYGFIVIGQIKSDEKCDTSFTSLNKEKLQKYYQQLPYIPLEKIKAAAHIIEACAGYEQLKHILKDQNIAKKTSLSLYVDQHLKDDLTTDLLCHEFNLSRRELYSFVKNYFNCTPAELVRFRRLNYATYLLKNTDTPISLIAEQCGIGDYNYFSKVFKKQYQMSPRRYRKLDV